MNKARSSKIFTFICFKRGSRAGLSVKNTKTPTTAYKNTLENKQIMCRLYRGQTTACCVVRGRIHLPVTVKQLKRAQKDRTCRLYCWIKWACPNHTGGGHNPPEKCVVPVSFCGLLSKRANLCRGLNGQSVPCARPEGANRPRSPAPHPYSSQLSFHLSTTYQVQQFSCHHLLVPNTSVNTATKTAATWWLYSFPNRKTNKI